MGLRDLGGKKELTEKQLENLRKGREKLARKRKKKKKKEPPRNRKGDSKKSKD